MYGAGKYPSPLNLVPEAREHVAVVSSLSKTYAMTGWRLGYTIAAEPLAAAMTKIQEHSTSNPCSISQKAAVEALAGDQGAVQAMVEEYRRRRDYFARVSTKSAISPMPCPTAPFTFSPIFPITSA